MCLLEEAYQCKLSQSLCGIQRTIYGSIRHQNRVSKAKHFNKIPEAHLESGFDMNTYHRISFTIELATTDTED